MASPGSFPDPFEAALRIFKSSLSTKQLAAIESTTYEDLYAAVKRMESEMNQGKKLQNMKRLNCFLEAMTQFSQVLDVFANSNQLVACIWGPVKFLLLATKTFAESFNFILDTYEQIGETLPLLKQYEDLFRTNNDMHRILVMLYEDILEFHQKALKRFRPVNLEVWRHLYHSGWKTFQAELGHIKDNLCRHKNDIDKQVSILAIQESRQHRRLDFEQLLTKQRLERGWVVFQWLHAANSIQDLEEHKLTWNDNPQTGQWLIDHKDFAKWRNSSRSTSLWLTGIPGAGKTILASRVVDEIITLQPQSVVVFFFFRQDDPQRGSLSEAIWSILSQLASRNDDILDMLYENAAEQSVRQAGARAKALLENALKIAGDVYIILDGLDECEESDGEHIILEFQRLLKDSMTWFEASLRCLYVCQHDRVAAKQLSRSVPRIQIEISDNQFDIQNYVDKRIEDLQQIHPTLTSRHHDMTRSKIMKFAKGMFLYAKLVMINLLEQLSEADVLLELQEDHFPQGIEDAYSRIFHRVLPEKATPKSNMAIKILSAILSAKRPLFWFEIQAMLSIHLDSDTIDKARRPSSTITPKDLCGSLVFVRQDLTLNVVHATARRSEVCRPGPRRFPNGSPLPQLSRFPGSSMEFSQDETRELLLESHYAFLDYAVENWLSHLSTICVHSYQERSSAALLGDICRRLTKFVEKHYAPVDPPLKISDSTTELLKSFSLSTASESVSQVLEATKMQHESLDVQAGQNATLDLPMILGKVRKELESMPPFNACIKEFYGSNIFKCPRVNCEFFHKGFTSAISKDKHMGQHDRPYRCTFVGCPRTDVGFATPKELQKHLHGHDTSAYKSTGFPSNKMLEKARRHSKTIREEVGSSAKKFRCDVCGQGFTRNHNLRMHKAAHRDEKNHCCSFCPNRFVRIADLKRHIETVHGNRRFKCLAMLPLNWGEDTTSAATWGCGKTFKRLDGLKEHLKSPTGRTCLQPLLQQNTCIMTDSLDGAAKKAYYCQGNLPLGSRKPAVVASWGCNGFWEDAESFGRHYQSMLGYRCLKPLFDAARRSEEMTENDDSADVKPETIHVVEDNQTSGSDDEDEPSN